MQTIASVRTLAVLLLHSKTLEDTDSFQVLLASGKYFVWLGMVFLCFQSLRLQLWNTTGQERFRRFIDIAFPYSVKVEVNIFPVVVWNSEFYKSRYNLYWSLTANNHSWAVESSVLTYRFYFTSLFAAVLRHLFIVEQMVWWLYMTSPG